MAINSVHKPSHPSLKTSGFDHRHLGRPNAVAVHMYIHIWLYLDAEQFVLPPVVLGVVFVGGRSSSTYGCS